MKLLRLTLQGFKSFADKTTIDFSDGMTVIVGPNGCGKSNISDAVRWVLGEQNVRQIRGQKAEDMIFSGSETRREKNGAEVTLVLDNSGCELPLDTTEVAITRRLLRNGDSDFYLNKRSCRLKDIQELLAPTGLGKGSMAIIGQNRVDQVLTAHADERRVIFEDVAGISLYRMRKTEGLRKLEKTAENMEREKDMMALLDEQLVPLKEGAERARKYKSLTQEKRAIDATMGLLKLTSSGRMTARYENEALKLQDEGSLWQTKLSQASLAKETLEKDRLAHQEKLREAGDAMADAQREMERLRGDYRVKEEALSHAKEKWEELRSVPDVPVCPLLHEPVFRFLLPVSLYEPVFLHHSNGSVLLPGVFHHRLDDPGSVPDVPVPDVFPAVCCCSLNSVGELQMQDFSSLEHPLFLLFYLQPSQHLCQLLLF